MEKALFKHIDALAAEYVELLKTLIRIPSWTGEEAGAQQLVKQVMGEIGVFHDDVFASNHPPFHATGRDYRLRPNVIGRLPGRGDDRHFVLNAHIDTTPVENEASWTHPPYGAVQVDQRLYGRGALDDKAGIAMMLLLADCLKRVDARFPSDVYFESVIEDEDSGNGTLACTEAGYFCEAGVIIDGTWPLRMMDAHLGQIWVNGTITGVPAAACSSGRAVNPIMVACEIIKSLEAYIQNKNREIERWLTISPPFFICPGSIRSGLWAGAAPEICRFEAQIGFPPPYLPHTVLGDVAQIAARVEAVHPGSAVAIQAGALYTPPFDHRNNPMTRIVKDTVREMTGENPLDQAVTGHCDLRHLRKKDGRPADACLYGPGGGANPHVRDEYYLVDHFAPVAKNIAAALVRYYDR